MEALKCSMCHRITYGVRILFCTISKLASKCRYLLYYLCKCVKLNEKSPGDLCFTKKKKSLHMQQTILKMKIETKLFANRKRKKKNNDQYLYCIVYLLGGNLKMRTKSRKLKVGIVPRSSKPAQQQKKISKRDGIQLLWSRWICIFPSHKYPTTISFTHNVFTMAHTRKQMTIDIVVCIAAVVYRFHYLFTYILTPVHLMLVVPKATI